ncbi:MAG TPA: hypothetical protein VN408_34060, partial [Actinoplanes sp.]|nr:hypothetical protein [Actinoplanes sp.]
CRRCQPPKDLPFGPLRVEVHGRSGLVEVGAFGADHGSVGGSVTAKVSRVAPSVIQAPAKSSPSPARRRFFDDRGGRVGAQPADLSVVQVEVAAHRLSIPAAGGTGH